MGLFNLHFLYTQLNPRHAYNRVFNMEGLQKCTFLPFPMRWFLLFCQAEPAQFPKIHLHPIHLLLFLPTNIHIIVFVIQTLQEYLLVCKLPYFSKL